MRTQDKHNYGLSKFYGEDFYKEQMEASLRSALKYAALLSALYKPDTVVDLGCGRGTWLKAFKEMGAKTLVGYDGTWNTQENMIDQSITFYGVDLNKPIHMHDAERFDLAMSVEVAEHLAPSSAQDFVRSLTNFSNVVIFGAAYAKQGGTNHINEQPHTYWARLFSSFGYAPYDFFRPIVWGDEEIPFWYQQNTFLYVLKNTKLTELLANAGHLPINNLSFMNCVHPILFENETGTEASIKRLLRKVVPKNVRPLIWRMRVAFRRN